MMINTQYRKIVRASAIYDLLVTAPFATPWTFAVVYQLLNMIAPVPPFEPTHILFVNLFGSIVLVWSILRIRDPQPIYGFYDSIGRALFSIWFFYYLIRYDINPVTWIFAVLELSWFVIQAYGFIRLSKQRV
ncbi:hypothetical protein [Aquirhabdus parva]|uniref:Uncharacterized protein n=1 Tax=Aquirhabdus parva TaxID=2283318 RepID=A0A345P881_9GAMM|nr:hypothetical protein [Aquirhabdus parva]AXI03490.1 hypothetical protein HYN46_11960 [Aquirhabdus parva]